MNIIYRPKEYCKEYAEISCGQLPQLIAVRKGLKPVIDELIPIEKYQEFKSVCSKYGLKMKPGWGYVEVAESRILDSIDGDKLTTTKYFGFPFSGKQKEGFVRVFIAKDEENIKLAQRFGWYPLVVKGRAIIKPFIDYLRFGKVLGYPECCVDFFKRYNDHSKFSNLYETYKNTNGELNYLCNCLFFDFTYSLIHHIPCSYNCKDTIKYAGALLKEIQNEDPDFAAKIEYYQKLPFLVFGEKNIYAFEGHSKGNEIHYTKSMYIGRPIDKKFGKEIEQGNHMIIEDEKIEIFKDNNLICKIDKEKPEDGFMLQFK
jgi:hypothetical protein